MAGNAQYWLAETFYVRKQFERAAMAFAAGYQTYPDNIKAPDNLLKLALSLARIDKQEDACVALKQLGEKFPKAPSNIRRRAAGEGAALVAPAETGGDGSCRAIDLSRFKDALVAATGQVSAGRWALAVSGGADSMALLRLTAAAVANPRARLLVMTVDHGLRAAADAEARQVAAWCAGLGLAHEILTVRETPPTRGLQAWARRQRYGRLLQSCRDQGIDRLLLGHQRQDQAETVLHRLRRGSGPAGLAGMAAPATFRGVRLCRPLLEETRAATEATCRAFGQAWLDDPSNQDGRFQRVRDRRFLASNAWPTADHLVRLGRAMAAARREVDHQVRQFLARHGVWHDGGWLTLARAAWVDLPETLALSVLSQAIQAVGGGDYPPAGTDWRVSRT